MSYITDNITVNLHRDFTYFNIFPRSICDTGRVFSMASSISEIHMSCQKKAAECGFLEWFLCFPTFQVAFLVCFCIADTHKKLRFFRFFLTFFKTNSDFFDILFWKNKNKTDFFRLFFRLFSKQIPIFLIFYFEKNQKKSIKKYPKKSLYLIFLFIFQRLSKQTDKTMLSWN